MICPRLLSLNVYRLYIPGSEASGIRILFAIARSKRTASLGPSKPTIHPPIAKYLSCAGFCWLSLCTFETIDILSIFRTCPATCRSLLRFLVLTWSCRGDWHQNTTMVSDKYASYNVEEFG